MANEKFNGRDIVMSIEQGSTYTEIAAATTGDVEITTKMLDVTSKDSGLWDESMPDRSSWKMTGQGYAIDDTASGVTGVSTNTLQTSQTTQQLINVKFCNTAGTLYYQGSGYLTTTKLTAKDGAVTSFDYTIQGTGALVTVKP